LKNIFEIAKDLEIPSSFVSPYGNYAAKIGLEATQGLQRRAKVILVTAMTPTPHGEGKTVTAIGVSMALNKLGRKAIALIRQPSLGPLFGVKGGATGGGKSTVEPSLEINMRFTGDIDAISASHNLLSAMIDNHIFHGNALRIDPFSIVWKRTADVEDRALRKVKVGLSQEKHMVPRDDAYVITAASEVMATFSLAKDYTDLSARLGRIIVAANTGEEPVTAADLKASGAMAAILRDAFMPNLAQTCEGTSALIHGGPFGNLATGTSSLVSINLGLALADFCVVEAGFGSDLGAEKFIDIVSRVGEFNVDAIILVASIRAIKYHSRVEEVGVELSTITTVSSSGSVALVSRGSQALAAGIENLAKHIENMKSFGINPIVAINRFPGDTDEEIDYIKQECMNLDVGCTVSTAFEEGSNGAIELAELAIEAASKGNRVKPLYLLEDTTEEKIRKIVTRIYGGDGVEFTPASIKDSEHIRNFGFDKLPVCIAKTSSSLSDDPEKLGRPRGFTCKVDEVRTSAGAGFNVVHMGSIMTMPGLPTHPAAENIYLSPDGTVLGVH
jgi:formate--tetrahydrofolate ligase